MITAVAAAAIVASLDNPNIVDPTFQQGEESAMLVYDLKRPSLYAIDNGIRAVRDAGFTFVGTRTLEDGRVAVEFSDRRLGHNGIVQLCHHNSLLPIAAFESRGWSAAR